MLDTILIYLPSNFLGLSLLGIAFVSSLVLSFGIQKSQWVIYTLLLWFPLESLVLMYTPIDYYGYVKYFPEILLYGLVVGALLHFMREKERVLPKHILNKWVIGFVVVAGISLLTNLYQPWIWTLGMRQLLRFVLMIYVMLWMEYEKEVNQRILFFGGSMVLLEIILAMIQYVAGGRLDAYLFSTRSVTVGNTAILGGIEQFWTAGSRVFATMGRYDRLGSFVALGLVMLFPWMYHLKKVNHKFWMSVGVLLGVFVLILTYSRASWIAAFAGIAVIGLWLKRDKKALMGIIGLLCAVVIYLAGFALTNANVTSITETANQSLAERMFEAVSFQAWRDSYDGYGRIFFIVNTPRMVVSQFPLFGVGPGRYGGGVAAALINTDMYDRLHLPFGIQNIYGQIDNNWMSIWGEFGTIGLAVFVGLFVVIIKMSRFVERHTHDIYEYATAQGLTGLTVGVMLLGFFGPYFEFRSLMFYYWTVVGIVGLSWYRIKSRGNFIT